MKDSAIKIIKPSKRGAAKTSAKRRTWTPERETKYREAVKVLEEAGFVVRREELKRGHGWRVVSGSCRSADNRYVFVDSRLQPEDQISFLVGKVKELAQVL